MLKKFFFNAFGLYVSVVVLFSVIYYGIHYFVPDSFIIHSKFNKHTVSKINRFFNALHQNEHYPQTMEEIKKLIFNEMGNEQPFEKTLELVNQYERLWRDIRYLKGEYSKAKVEMEELGNKINKKRDFNQGQYEKKYYETVITPLQKKLEKISAEIKLIEEAAEKNSKRGDHQKAVDAYSDLKRKITERGEIEVLIPQKKVVMFDFLLNGGGAGVEEELRVWNELKEKTWKYSNEISELERRQNTLLFNFQMLHMSLERELASKANWLDFLYFSIGISATITFGDIIPNMTLTRLAVISQLLACLVIVAKILDRIIRPSKQHIASEKEILNSNN